ncbi:aldehyde dehydrogenase family protein, partial [Chromobacterium piscinae]
MARSHAEWKQLAAELNIEGRAFIDGAYREAADGKRFDCVNPATGAKLADISHCGEAEVEAAVKAARRAFDSGTWSGLAPRQR